MVSAKRLFQQKSRAEGRTFLKYADLPFGTRLVTVRVIELRETPKLNSPCLIDIMPQLYADDKQISTEKTSVPINLTNMGRLAEIIGDDLTAVRGMDVTFGFSTKTNPNSRKQEDDEVMGFDLIEAKLPPAASAPQEPKKKGRR